MISASYEQLTGTRPFAFGVVGTDNTPVTGAEVDFWVVPQGGTGEPAGPFATTCHEVEGPPLGVYVTEVDLTEAGPTGWHVSGTFDIAVQAPGDPLTEVEQVSVLEAGGVVVAYNAITDADRAAREQRVSERYDGRVAVTTYDKIDKGETALTVWGVLQRCERLDLAALDQFVAAYADEQPATPGDQ